jgi:hypothetical protein
MPRVKSPDSLYKSFTNKTLPQLPQSETICKVGPETTMTPTIRKVSDTSETEEDAANSSTTEEDAPDTAQARPPIPEETIPYADSLWQTFHLQEATLTLWTLSTNLKASMEQTDLHLQDISHARIKYDCLISLCKGISTTNRKLRTFCQRAIDQHQALIQKGTQLLNASNFVRENNDNLIFRSLTFLTVTPTPCNLQAECEATLAQAKQSSISSQGTLIPRRDDLCKELELAVTLNKDIGTVIENIEAINGLLGCHKQDIDVKVVGLNTEIVGFVSKRGLGGLRRMLCFR